MGVEELLDFAWIDVFSAANNHIAGAAGEVNAAVGAHDAQVAGMQPSIGVDDLRRAFRVAVIAFHESVAAHANLALLAHRHGLLASPRRGDPNLGLRHGAAHSVDANLNGIVGVAHGDHRRCLGLAIGDDQLVTVHLVQYALHQLDRAGRAAHHAGAQAGEVEAGEVGQREFRHIHGRNSIDRSGALVVNCLERGARVKGPTGKNDGRAGIQRGHGADDATIAVEQGHRNHNLVLLGIVESLREKLPVVDDVVMGEQHALGQSSSAAGVLDVGHVVRGDVIRQTALGVEQRRPLGRIKVDGVLEREIKPVTRAAQNLLVIGSLVLVPKEESLHARALQSELKFVGAVRGIHVDQRRSGPCAAHVHHDPLDAVGGPEAHAVATADAQRPEPARHAVSLDAQLCPCEPLLLVTRGHGKALRKAAGGTVEQAADGQIEQCAVGAARVALGTEVFFYRHGSELGTEREVYTPSTLPESEIWYTGSGPV